MLSPTSSSQNTDNSPTTEDSDSDHKSATKYKERRREAHTQAEQKRRDAIKRGYEDLQSLVPKCQQQDSVSSYKLSKASILQRSIDYIQFLQQQNRELDDRRQSLRKETIALQIMKTNYEQMVKQHQDTQTGQPSAHVSDEVKMHVFQALCDQLFMSFDETVPTDNFADLSRCVFSWLEEKCTPNTLKQLTANILSQLPPD
jgi:MAX-like protein X